MSVPHFLSLRKSSQYFSLQGQEKVLETLEMAPKWMIEINHVHIKQKMTKDKINPN